MPLISFDTSWKHQKIRGFLILSGGIERDQWHEEYWGLTIAINNCFYHLNENGDGKL